MQVFNWHRPMTGASYPSSLWSWTHHSILDDFYSGSQAQSKFRWVDDLHTQKWQLKWSQAYLQHSSSALLDFYLDFLFHQASIPTLTNVVYHVRGVLTPLDTWIWINFLEFFEVVTTGIWTRNCFIPLICSKMISFLFFFFHIK